MAHDDLTPLLRRRAALKLLGGAGLGFGLIGIVGCGSDDDPRSGTSTTTTTTTTTPSGDVEVIPEETAGPYPGDGSNGPNVLTQDGVVRSDIRSSFGTASGTADGVPLTITMKLVDTANGDAPLSDAAVYVWHCDRDGRYSMYSQGAEDQNYLRGVQESGGDGTVTFLSTFPGAYDGRWPHIHFEVYPSLAEATAAGNPVATSQIALPEAVCDQVYATSGYEQSVANMDRTSLTSDMVFGDDGAVDQLATMSGTVDGGLTATLTVGV
jgi:protocatechuate 3,4-dioxygenase beta subunit